MHLLGGKKRRIKGEEAYYRSIKTGRRGGDHVPCLSNSGGLDYQIVFAMNILCLLTTLANIYSCVHVYKFTSGLRCPAPSEDL